MSVPKVALRPHVKYKVGSNCPQLLETFEEGGESKPFHAPQGQRLQPRVCDSLRHRTTDPLRARPHSHCHARNHDAARRIRGTPARGGKCTDSHRGRAFGCGDSPGHLVLAGIWGCWERVAAWSGCMLPAPLRREAENLDAISLNWHRACILRRRRCRRWSRTRWNSSRSAARFHRWGGPGCRRLRKCRRTEYLRARPSSRVPHFL